MEVIKDQKPKGALGEPEGLGTEIAIGPLEVLQRRGAGT